MCGLFDNCSLCDLRVATSHRPPALGAYGTMVFQGAVNAPLRHGRFDPYTHHSARMVKRLDTLRLGRSVFGHGGSNPSTGMYCG